MLPVSADVTRTPLRDGDDKRAFPHPTVLVAFSAIPRRNRSLDSHGFGLRSEGQLGVDTSYMGNEPVEQGLLNVNDQFGADTVLVKTITNLGKLLHKLLMRNPVGGSHRTFEPFHLGFFVGKVLNDIFA